MRKAVRADAVEIAVADVKSDADIARAAFPNLADDVERKVGAGFLCGKNASRLKPGRISIGSFSV